MINIDNERKDTFQGDDGALIRSIDALISLDERGALVPHGIGGHARELLRSAAARLARAQVERGVGVEELRSFIDDMEVSTSVPTAYSTAEWEEGYRSGVNVACDELRALLPRPPKENDDE